MKVLYQGEQGNPTTPTPSDPGKDQTFQCLNSPLNLFGFLFVLREKEAGIRCDCQYNQSRCCMLEFNSSNRFCVISV